MSPTHDAPGAIDVSVLTPVLNGERQLTDAVAGMLAQTFAGTLEFLFVDGRSQDASREILAELAAGDARIRVLDNPARRIPHALNLGLNAARGEFVVRMDAHTRYPSDYVRLGVERLRRGDAVHVSGPQIALGDGTWSRRVALALQTPLGAGGAGHRRAADAEHEVDSGFTGVWRRETLLAAGGWDEQALFDEDGELAARLSAAGGRLVCVPAMAAEYLPRDSLARLAEQYWRYGGARIYTARHHPGSLRPSQLLPPAVAATALLALGGPLRGPARAGLALYAGALVAAAARAARAAPPADAAALPAVLATMHLAYGAGVLAGSVRHGPPVAAVAAAVRRLAAR